MIFINNLFGQSTRAKINEMMKDCISDDVPHYEDSLANLTAVLINSDPAIGCPRILPPGYINIGGYHILPPKPLPKVINSNFLKFG